MRLYTIVASLILTCLLGVGAVLRMSIDIFPEIDIPVVSVVWTYRGMSAGDIRDRMLTLHERQLASLGVFAPVFLLQGTAKQLFSPLSLSVCVSLIASLALSFTLVPVLFAFPMRSSFEDHTGHSLQIVPLRLRFNVFGAIHHGFEEGFTRLREGCRNKDVTIASDDGNVVAIDSDLAVGDKIALNLTSQVAAGEKVRTNADDAKNASVQERKD
jgi:multidrug efflux pump subunit AcrB